MCSPYDSLNEFGINDIDIKPNQMCAALHVTKQAQNPLIQLYELHDAQLR